MSRPNISDSAQVTAIDHRTADVTIDRNWSPSHFTNLGASGAVVFTLPQDAKGGEVFKFTVLAAQSLRIDPGAAGAIYGHNGDAFAKQTDDKYIASSAVGATVCLTSLGNGDWIAEQSAVIESDGFEFDTVQG